jgi:Potential Queuosine, Q, salvage protein family
VLERARDVRLVPEGVNRVADRIAAGGLERPAWRVPPHWWDDRDPEATATYILLLDGLNFSFWGEPKWRVKWNGAVYDGYWALAASLRRALDAGEPLYDPTYLATRADAARLLVGKDGTRIPLPEARQDAIREVGHGIVHAREGSFLRRIEQAGRSSAALARLVAERFPSFRDVAEYEGREIPFFKRAQILVSDLWGAFEGKGPGAFDDLDVLTMFADYKVPQVLHGLGVLAYSPGLEATLAAKEEIPYGDPREVEIRAASVQAVEAIREALDRRGLALDAFDLDWRLWALGQGREWPLPYHRTRSVAY